MSYLFFAPFEPIFKFKATLVDLNFTDIIGIIPKIFYLLTLLIKKFFDVN